MNLLTKSLIVCSSLLALGACSPRPGAGDASPAPATGADRDAHGCIASAGYTWSPVRGACVRLFEDGVRFEQSEAPQGQTPQVVYVVVAPAQGEPVTAAELHASGQPPMALQVVHTPEGDIRPVVLANKAEKVEVTLHRDQVYLSLRGVQYHCFCDKEERIRNIR